jgi:hypothetical protein
MKKLKLLFIRKQRNKGQSFMEMTIVLGVLLLLLLGMLEFGNLLNQYVNLVDGAREGARFGSNNDPFFDPVTKKDDYDKIQTSFYTNIDQIIDGFSTYDKAGAIAPIILNPDEDEVLISFLSIRTGGTYIPYGPWCKFCKGKHPSSKILTDHGFIAGSLNDHAPNTGVLIVEIFYAYHQLLNLPLFTSVIPNPIQVHAYAVMPLSAAEPTPVVP